MTFVSDAPLRRAAHVPGCRFGPGFYKVVYLDEAGARVVRHFPDQAGSDLLMRILPPAAEGTAYRDACLDALKRVDAGTPDVVDADWWLALPRAQAMAELGIDRDDEYARVHRSVSDAVYTRDNRERQGGVRASIVVRRRKRAHNAHLFAGGRLINLR